MVALKRGNNKLFDPHSGFRWLFLCIDNITDLNESKCPHLFMVLARSCVTLPYKTLIPQIKLICTMYSY